MPGDCGGFDVGHDPLRNFFKWFSASRQKCVYDVCSCYCERPSDYWTDWPDHANWQLKLPVPTIKVNLSAVNLPPLGPGGCDFGTCFTCCFLSASTPEEGCALESGYWEFFSSEHELLPLYSKAAGGDDEELSFEPFSGVLCGGWTGQWVLAEITGPSGDNVLSGVLHSSCTDLTDPVPWALQTMITASCSSYGGMDLAWNFDCYYSDIALPLQFGEFCNGSIYLLPDQCIFDCGYYERDTSGNPVINPDGGVKLIYSSDLRDCRRHPVCRCSDGQQISTGTECSIDSAGGGGQSQCTASIYGFMYPENSGDCQDEFTILSV